MTGYKPGSFFVVEVTGLAGAAIYLGQFLAQAQSVFGHAGMITAEDGATVEAAPGGAFVGNISAYKDRALLICDGPVQSWLTENPALAAMDYERDIRDRVVEESSKLVGTPYSALDYAALAALHLHLPSAWIRRRVESSGHLICSALVDRAFMNAGIRLFDDKPYKLAPNKPRYVGDVTPSDLAAWADDWSNR